MFDCVWSPQRICALNSFCYFRFLLKLSIVLFLIFIANCLSELCRVPVLLSGDISIMGVSVCLRASNVKIIRDNVLVRVDFLRGATMPNCDNCKYVKKGLCLPKSAFPIILYFSPIKFLAADLLLRNRFSFYICRRRQCKWHQAVTASLDVVCKLYRERIWVDNRYLWNLWKDERERERERERKGRE